MTSIPIMPLENGAGWGPAATLEDAAELVRGVSETFWAAQSGDELVRTIQVVAKLRAMLDAVELSATTELEHGPAGQAALREAGWASTKEFVTHTMGGRKGSGPATVRLAKDLACFPRLAEALAGGAISRVKAQIIVAAVTKLPVDEALREKAIGVLLEDAQRLSADDLERAGRHVLEVVDPDGVDRELEKALDRTERAAHLNRDLMVRFDQLGGGNGKFNGSKEDLLLLKTVLMSLAVPQPAEPGACGGDEVCTDLVCKRRRHEGRDPREHGARMFDALIQLARIGQASGALPDCRGGIPQVAVTMDLDQLKEGLGEARTSLGEDLTASQVRRMACDADVVPGVLGADGAILDVGRTQRLVTAALWVVLVIRDKHCVFPGCRRPPVMCHAHHIRHWVDGGATSLDNLVLLCGTHHRTIHNTPWEVRLEPDGRRPEFRPPRRDIWIRGRPPDG